MTNAQDMERLISNTLAYFLQADRNTVGSMVYQALRAASIPTVSLEYKLGYLDSTATAVDVLGTEEEREAFGIVLDMAKKLVVPTNHPVVQPAVAAIYRLIAA